jgi:tetratricopeptide (TPR) repeat protein
MAVDFTYSPRESYRDYLGRTYLRQKIDLVLSKQVRTAIGSVAELFFGGDSKHNAIRDYQYGGPDDRHEILTVQMYHVCATLGPLAGDLVTGFHALFDDHTPAPPNPAGPIADALALVADQRYDEALAALGQADAGDDPRIDQLRAMLLGGIPGQPKSAGILDLPAAEHAYVSAARKAEATRPVEAVRALVAAGRCAYADGRFDDAAHYFGLALDRDPRSGEANYQMARLRMHAGEMSRVRDFLVLAFRASFSYALRAAGDQLFRQDPELVEDCVALATKRIVSDIRSRIAGYADLIQTLRRDGDPEFGLARLERLPDVLEQFEALKAVPEPVTLKRALCLEKRVLAFNEPLQRVARDYCVILRKAEVAVSVRGVEEPAPPDHTARAHHICDVATATVMAIAAAATGASLAAIFLTRAELAVEIAVVSIVALIAAVAVRLEPAAHAELCWFIERRWVVPRAKRQAERDERARRRMVDDNRANHRARVNRIAARFGISS